MKPATQAFAPKPFCAFKFLFQLELIERHLRRHVWEARRRLAPERDRGPVSLRSARCALKNVLVEVPPPAIRGGGVALAFFSSVSSVIFFLFMKQKHCPLSPLPFVARRSFTRAKVERRAEADLSSLISFPLLPLSAS